MSNPVLSSPRLFGGSRAAGVGGAAAAPDIATLEHAYTAPAATPRDTGRMTYDDVIVRTAGMLVVLVAAGAATWVLAPGLLWVGMIVGLVLGLVNAFKREPSVPLIMAYAVAQGVFLGGLSAVLETAYPGIAVQAVLATAATFAVTLALFRSGKVRATPRGRRIVLVAVAGYLLFSLVNVGLVWFGGMDGWGLRSVTVAGIPLGVVIGVFAVGLAAYMLVLDFDTVQRGVTQGVPTRFAWKVGFGLVVTLVWLYLEFLRLFAILRGD